MTAAPARRAAVVVVVWLAVAGAAGGALAAPPESIRGRGLVAGEALVLFGEVTRCGGEPALPEAQTFVSTDGGKSWQKRGPGLPGSELLFARPSKQDLLVAGQHTAEGPAADPFVIAADGQAHTIREGPGELLEVMASGDQDLTARIRPTGPHGERRPGAVQVYVSHDGGRTWSVARPGQASSRGAEKLARSSTRSGDWRLLERQDGGFDIQKREGRTWTTVRAFPWTPCAR